MTVFMERMRYFKMDREKEELVYEIPEAEILDYWKEDSECIIYNNWDRIKDWLKKILRFFVFLNLKKIWRFFKNRFLKTKKDLEIFWTCPM